MRKKTRFFRTPPTWGGMHPPPLGGPPTEGVAPPPHGGPPCEGVAPPNGGGDIDMTSFRYNGGQRSRTGPALRTPAIAPCLAPLVRGWTGPPTIGVCSPWVSGSPLPERGVGRLSLRICLLLHFLASVTSEACDARKRSRRPSEGDPPEGQWCALVLNQRSVCDSRLPARRGAIGELRPCLGLGDLVPSHAVAQIPFVVVWPTLIAPIV